MDRFLGYRVEENFNQAVFLTERHIREGRGEKVAIYYQGEGITFRELAERADRFGDLVRTLGVGPEDRVLLVLWDCPEYFYSFLGAMKIGAIPVPVNTMGRPEDYLFFLNDSRAKLVVANDALYEEKISPIRERSKYLMYVIVVGREAPGALNFSALLEKASSRLVPEETSRDDVAYWMYTSGTTGLPKAVVHLHHDLLYAWPPVSETVYEIREDDVIFCTSKMFFAYGKNASFDTSLLYGVPVVLWPKWPAPDTISEVIEMVRRYRPTLFFSVPSLYSALLREIERGAEADFSSVRAFVTSGEPMPKPIVERLWRTFGKRIINAIGSTDVGGQYIANPNLQERPDASGKVLVGFEARFLSDVGNEVGIGEVGELWLMNDGITPGYWRRHEKNKEVFRGHWFNTGDLFLIDEQGYLYYQGRSDDMLKFSGQWVAPIEVENVLMEHPAVEECAVVAAPSEEGLIKGKAFVVLREGYEPRPELEKDLLGFLRSKLAHFKVPKGVKFVRELPRTVTGKVQRYRLRVGP